MSTWKDAFHEDVKKYIEANEWGFEDKIKEVTSVYEDTRSGGYCETCWYEETVTVIEYVGTDGLCHETEISINMKSFMESL